MHLPFILKCSIKLIIISIALEVTRRLKLLILKIPLWIILLINNLGANIFIIVEVSDLVDRK